MDGESTTSPLPPAGSPSPADDLPAGTTSPAAGNGGGSADAESLAIRHQGLRGGKARADGLIPGSEAAKRADRLYDVIRKWQDRNPGQIHPQEKSLPPAIRAKFDARRKPLPTGATPVAAAIRRIPVQELPPPLPSASPGVGSAPPVADRDLDNVASAANAALVRWQGTDFEPLLVEAVKLVEEFRQYSREKICLKVGLPKEVIAEMERDAAWADGLKKTFCTNGSIVLGKLANSAGISADYKAEIFCGLAALAIVGGEFRMQRRFAKTIAAHNLKRQQEEKQQPTTGK